MKEIVIICDRCGNRAENCYTALAARDKEIHFCEKCWHDFMTFTEEYGRIHLWRRNIPQFSPNKEVHGTDPKKG